MRAFIYFLTVVIAFTASSYESLGAVVNPNAYIAQGAARPSCITLQPSSIGYWHWFVEISGETPAIEIKNRCAEKIVISDIRISAKSFNSIEAIPWFNVVIDPPEVFLNGELQLGRQYFFTTKSCSEANDLLQADFLAMREYYLKRDGALPPVQNAKEALENRKIEVLCNPITIMPGYSLRVAIKGEGSYFGVSGVLNAGEKPIEVTIKGRLMTEARADEVARLLAEGSNDERHAFAQHFQEHQEISVETLMDIERAAANEGYTLSKLSLGLCYSERVGCLLRHENKEEGYFWYSLVKEDDLPETASKPLFRKRMAKLEAELGIEKVTAVKKRVENWKKSYPQGAKSAP